MTDHGSAAELPPIPHDLFTPPAPRRWGFALPAWTGMTLEAWLGLLWRNRFRVAPRYWPRALLVSCFVPLNSVSDMTLRLLLDPWLRRRRIRAPLFVVGHWRSGTTLLHELLALDPRHVSPDGFAAFCPGHFLWSRPLVRPVRRFLVPAYRPMDPMKFDLSLPQEDEFALMLLGVASPLETLAFPRGSGKTDPGALTEREQRAFARVMRRFFARVMLGKGDRRLVLKSPAHMARLPLLSRIYPDLKVLHIVREPGAVCTSMVRMVSALQRLLRLSTEEPTNRPAMMFALYRRMFDRFEAARPLLPPGALAEIRYEDLLAEPIAVLRDVYAKLDLGSFEPLEAALRPLVRDGYFRPAVAPVLNERQRAAVRHVAAAEMRRYGYDQEGAAA